MNKSVKFNLNLIWFSKTKFIVQSSEDEEQVLSLEEINLQKQREEEKKKEIEEKLSKFHLKRNKHSNFGLLEQLNLNCLIEKEKEEANMSKKEKTKRDLEEIDKLFAEMGIEVAKEEKKEPQESKKNKKKKKKDKKANVDNTENAEEKKDANPADDKKEDKPVEVKKDDKHVDEKKQEQTEEQCKGEESQVDKEAAIKEALNKRFKNQNKKQHQDDAAMLAKKEALVNLD